MDTAPRGKKRRNPCKDCTKGTSIRLGKEERARDRSIWQRTQDSITGAEPQFKLLAPHPSESSSLWYSFILFSDDSVMNMLMWFFTDQGQPEEIHRLDRRGRWPGGPFFGGDRDGRHPERAGRVHRSAGAGEGCCCTRFRSSVPRSSEQHLALHSKDAVLVRPTNAPNWWTYTYGQAKTPLHIEHFYFCIYQRTVYSLQVG